jgi:hypothetical protein
MSTHRTTRSRRLRDEEDEEELLQQQKLKRKRLLMWGVPAAVLVVAALVWGLSGSNVPKQTVFPESKLKLDRLYDAYKSYCDRNKKAPANEQALKDYVQKLPQPDKDKLNLPANVDELFVNPRDGQKYEARWGMMADPATAPAKALIWEKSTDNDGRRWARLANGATDFYYDQEFDHLKK